MFYPKQQVGIFVCAVELEQIWDMGWVIRHIPN